MDYETLKTELLKLARNAFETACTPRDNRRIEVCLHNGEPKTSDTLEESDNIIYAPNRILCYRVYGHDFLEGEIKTWIDYARLIPQPTDEAPLPEPTDIEKSIRELIGEIAARNGVSKDDVSSFEVFANLPPWICSAVSNSRSSSTGGTPTKRKTGRCWHSRRSKRHSNTVREAPNHPHRKKDAQD